MPTPDWAKPFGTISVELFYSLSGYLIGHILLDLVDAPSSAGWLATLYDTPLNTHPAPVFLRAGHGGCDSAA